MQPRDDESKEESLFEKDILEISFLDLLRYLAGRRKVRYQIEEYLYGDPCSSKFLRSIKAVVKEGDECRLSVEFGVRIALAALTWIAFVEPRTADKVKNIIKELLYILNEV